MRTKTLILFYLFISLLLISSALWFVAKPLHLKRLEVARIARIQKICMKESPKRRDRHTTERTVKEAQRVINNLLKGGRRIKKETLFSNKNLDKKSLFKFLKVVNNLTEKAILTISVHTNPAKSKQESLTISQERADLLKEYFFKKSELVLVTAIGYGEEIPLENNDKNISNERMEFNLKKVE